MQLASSFIKMPRTHRSSATWGQLGQLVTQNVPAPAQTSLISNLTTLPEQSTTRTAIDAVASVVVGHSSLRSCFNIQADLKSSTQESLQEIEINSVHFESINERQEWINQRPEQISRADLSRGQPTKISVLHVQESIAIYLLIPHVFIDGRGNFVLTAELLSAASGGRIAGGMQIDEIAAEEAQPHMIEQSDAAIGHWIHALTTAPAPAIPKNRHSIQYSISLPALEWHIQTAATRMGVMSTSVLAAAATYAINSVLDLPSVALNLECHNRIRRAQLTAIACMVQPGIVVGIPSTAKTIEQFTSQVETATLSAYRHARYNPLSLASSMAQNGLRAPFYLNDARTTAVRPGTRAIEHSKDIPGVLPIIETPSTVDDRGADLYFLAFSDDLGGFCLNCRANVTLFPPTLARQMIGTLVSFILSASDDPEGYLNFAAHPTRAGS